MTDHFSRCPNISTNLHKNDMILHLGDGEYNIKSDSSPERDHAHDDDITKEPELTDGKKKKRKPYRPGTTSVCLCLSGTVSVCNCSPFGSVSQVSGVSWCVSVGVKPVRAESNCVGKIPQRLC